MTLKEWWEQNQDKEISLTEEGWIGLKDLEPEKPGKWKPKRGDIYWSIHGDGEAYAKEWKDSLYDRINYSMGNVFKNEPEAKSEIKRMKIRAELLDYGGKEAREIVMPADRIYPYRYKIVLNNYHEVTYQSTCLPTAFEITFETEEEACCHFCGKIFDPQEEGYAHIEGEAQLVCMSCAEKIIDALKDGD